MIEKDTPKKIAESLIDQSEVLYKILRYPHAWTHSLLQAEKLGMGLGMRLVTIIIMLKDIMVAQI